ncbi:FAD-dependent oxidoreductase [Pseudoxanthomonas helianthi]|uniref:FAD-dependent oxidoreductase n=1 Tax=Pseudoxanthomonas helianthi TaxID=1453541 RepID=A0A940X1E6_9GAMM|nr:FAD-dependent oxidoreductase [Pseudoxanthomonas helianthi]MBP3983377.1 FAD-dependent oxidoreductase [Pseudoxanthomonas helianthi]
MSSARTLPIWTLDRISDGFRPGLPPSADVVVVGAGVAGLTTACRLAQDGRDVCVVDREGIGQGESSRTTAHLASALDDRFYHLAHWHGAEGARRAAESHAAAIDWIERLAMSADDDCGFRRVPGYLFSYDGKTDRLEKELGAARDAGLEVSFEAGIPQLPNLGPALRFENQARIDMGRYLRILAETCRASGVKFCLDEIAEATGGDSPTVVSAAGTRLPAAAVVIATDVPFHERFAVHTKQAAYRTYVVAGPVDEGALPDALIWDDGDPYHYIRLLDTADGKWVIVGGEDHKTGQDHDPKAFVRLQEWAREKLPGVHSFTHAWSGQIIEPADGLAFIGADAGGEENLYVITGDSGNGITHGTLGGLLIADLIAGRDNAWATLYDPKRKLLRASGDWIRENTNVALQYRDWVESGDIARPEELAPGEGAVVRHGMHRIAVYRKGDGDFAAFSAQCPHLGCAVRWSPQEKSWDCPCHGSRFDAQTGAVLNGPANAPLQPSAWPLEDRGPD